MSDVQGWGGFRSIDELLWPNGGTNTLHDAELRKITLDYVSSNAQLVLNVCVGDPDSDDLGQREACRLGTLVVEGLREFSIEPSASERVPNDSRGGLWIDAELGEPGDNRAALTDKANPTDLNSEVRFWIYVRDTNSFMRVAAKGLHFVWDDDRA